MKKYIIWVAAVVLAAMLFVACSHKTAGTEQASTGIAASSTQQLFNEENSAAANDSDVSGTAEKGKNNFDKKSGSGSEKEQSTSSAANGKSADNEVDVGGGSTAFGNKGTTSTPAGRTKHQQLPKQKNLPPIPRAG